MMTPEQRARLTELAATHRAAAANVGPMHTSYECAFEIEAYLRGDRTMVDYRDAEDCIQKNAAPVKMPRQG